MWVSRLDRTRDFVNDAYADFLGVGAEEACHFDWRNAIHPDDSERIVAESIAGEASLKRFTLEGATAGRTGSIAGCGRSRSRASGPMVS